MNKSIRIFLLFLLFASFLAIKGFASKLFYDPFIEFFKNDYLVNGVFPNYSSTQLFIDIALRYLLNGLISLGVIYLLFQKKILVLFSIKLYLILFVLLTTFYFLLLNTEFSSGYLLAFYARRLLIHPVILIALLPAFYFQYKLKKG